MQQDGQQYEFDCEDSQGELQCLEGVLFIPIDEGQLVTYNVTWADESAVGEFELEWDVYTPNGEGCEPTCRTDEHEVMLFRFFE